MRSASKKPLMHYLGEFVGHIVKAFRTDPGRKRIVVNKAVEEMTSEAPAEIHHYEKDID